MPLLLAAEGALLPGICTVSESRPPPRLSLHRPRSAPDMQSLGSCILTNHFLCCPKAHLCQTPRHNHSWIFTGGFSPLSPCFFNCFPAAYTPHSCCSLWVTPHHVLSPFNLPLYSLIWLSHSQKCFFSATAGSRSSLPLLPSPVQTPNSPLLSKILITFLPWDFFLLLHDTSPDKCLILQWLCCWWHFFFYCLSSPFPHICPRFRYSINQNVTSVFSTCTRNITAL